MLVWLVLACTLIAIYGGEIFGFNISGLAWVFPLFFSLLVLSRNPNRISFPVKIWLPWIVLLFSYLIYVVLDGKPVYFRVSPVQRTFQILSPVFVGMAISTCDATPRMVEKLTRLLRWFTYVLIGEILLIAGSQFVELSRTGLATDVMTIMLLAVYFANRYLLFSEKQDLQLWLFLVCMPVLAITRMGIAATLLTLPLSFSPMSLMRRAVILALIGCLGIAIFQLPEIQKKMFRSGEGEITSINITDIGRNEDLDTSGRASMWHYLESIADEKPWTGHGTGQAETAIFLFTGGMSGYPHNDWLLTYFDYGILGLVVYGTTMLFAALHGFKCRKACRSKNTMLLLMTGISAFVPFSIVMYTDNIMVYASFFGNLQFIILGIAYAALRTEQVASSPRRTQ